MHVSTELTIFKLSKFILSSHRAHIQFQQTNANNIKYFGNLEYSKLTFHFC